jgi:hypothetical protein
MSVLGIAACGILNYPEYLRQLLIVPIVNLPQRRAERAQGCQSGARRSRLNGEQNARTDVSRARRGHLNDEQSAPRLPQRRATTRSTFGHPVGGATAHPSDTMVISGPCVIVGRHIHIRECGPTYAIQEPFRASDACAMHGNMVDP